MTWAAPGLAGAPGPARRAGCAWGAGWRRAL